MYTCIYVWINNILPFFVETVTVLFLNCVRNIWSKDSTYQAIIIRQMELLVKIGT